MGTLLGNLKREGEIQCLSLLEGDIVIYQTSGMLITRGMVICSSGSDDN